MGNDPKINIAWRAGRHRTSSHSEIDRRQTLSACLLARPLQVASDPSPTPPKHKGPLHIASYNHYNPPPPPIWLSPPSIPSDSSDGPYHHHSTLPRNLPPRRPQPPPGNIHPRLPQYPIPLLPVTPPSCLPPRCFTIEPGLRSRS